MPANPEERRRSIKSSSAYSNYWSYPWMSSRVAGSPTKQCSSPRDVKTTQGLLAGSLHSPSHNALASVWHHQFRITDGFARRHNSTTPFLFWKEIRNLYFGLASQGTAPHK